GISHSDRFPIGFISHQERETFIKGKGLLVTYDASRTFGSPHTKDAGVVSPRALRTRPSTTSLDISNLDKPRRIEPFKRTSETSTFLKRISWWRGRAEGTLGDRMEGSFASPADPSPGGNSSWGAGSLELDKSTV
ncbi:hypothetical protein FOZ62_031687, partial [Perkinsus olseni]